MTQTTQRRGTRVAQVTRTLREAIAAGSYAVGDRLPSEAQLTERFGVSRTVVREAIASLRADGLVQPRQGAGVFVTAPRPKGANSLAADGDDELIEVLELRMALETEAARLAALRRSVQQAAEIARCAEASADPTGDVAQKDFAFHAAIAAATNNPKFLSVLEMISPEPLPKTGVGPSVIAASAAEHSDIAEAIAEGNSELARATMRGHLEASLARLRARLRQEA